jgi:ubiquitin-protein ligase E3 C
MFQTFSGSSRRPRQVNLSGQNTNPFAANSWTPAASGTRQTVANAQQERLQRQQERERLNATKRIQRIWRGHKVRRELADLRRHAWDRAGSSRGGSGSEAVLVEQLRLLMAFFSSRRHDDMRRLEYLSQEIVSLDYDLFLDRQDIQPQITRLAKATLEALHV